MMITGNRATPDTIGEILSDIESQGVQPQRSSIGIGRCFEVITWIKKPIDLHAVIHGGLALVAHDMRARQIRGR